MDHAARAANKPTDRMNQILLSYFIKKVSKDKSIFRLPENKNGDRTPCRR
jgi:hypothetical protein